MGIANAANRRPLLVVASVSLLTTSGFSGFNEAPAEPVVPRGLAGAVVVLDAALLEDSLRIRIAVQGMAALPFLPRYSFPDSVWIVGDSSLPPSVRGSVDLASEQIRLNAGGVATWDDDTLEQVVRHELAHLALYWSLEGATLPPWFAEGYAELHSGGLSCADRAAIVREVKAGSLEIGGTTLSWVRTPRSPVGYSLFALAVEHLELEYPGATRTLLGRAPLIGFWPALEEATRSRAEDFVVGWHAHVDEVLRAPIAPCRKSALARSFAPSESSDVRSWPEPAITF